MNGYDARTTTNEQDLIQMLLVARRDERKFGGIGLGPLELNAYRADLDRAIAVLERAFEELAN